jgi:hypothetical protein
MRLGDPVPDPLLLRRQESKLDIWICSQELWPLDHRHDDMFTVFDVLSEYISGSKNK